MDLQTTVVFINSATKDKIVTGFNQKVFLFILILNSEKERTTDVSKARTHTHTTAHVQKAESVMFSNQSWKHSKTSTLQPTHPKKKK